MQQIDVIRDELLNIMEQNKDVYIICIDGFDNIACPQIKKLYPDRFIQGGIAEADSLSIAAGLALAGKTVFLIITGVYVSTRALEQLRIDIGYNNANVKIIAAKTGVKWNSNAGYSHWAIEDIATVRPIPNIIILNPATPYELKDHIYKALNSKGAYYIRIGNLHSEFNISYEYAKLPILSRGKDVAIIAEGSMVEEAYGMLKELKHAGIKASLYSASVIKPFDESTIIKLIDRKIPIVTMEEQTYGGITSIVSEIIAIHGKKAKLLPIRICNEHYNIVGSNDYVSKEILDFPNTLNKIINFTDKKFCIFAIPILKFKAKLESKYKVKSLHIRLFNIIPILKIKYRERIHKGKPRFKLYLFDFIRIL